MRFIKRIGDRGAVTLPSDVREALGVKEGDIVEFDVIAVVKRAEPLPSAPKEATGPTDVPVGHKSPTPF